MQKLINRPAEPSQAESGDWLDLPEIADVELTSEHPDFPIESVFSGESGQGWKAAESGPQTIRLQFHKPQAIKKVHLEFHEISTERTQEFSLEYRAGNDSPFRDIVRQQWSFSPQGSMDEVENYKVEADGVTTIQLTITPDIQYKQAIATLQRWMIG